MRNAFRASLALVTAVAVTVSTTPIIQSSALQAPVPPAIAPNAPQSWTSGSYSIYPSAESTTSGLETQWQARTLGNWTVLMGNFDYIYIPTPDLEQFVSPETGDRYIDTFEVFPTLSSVSIVDGRLNVGGPTGSFTDVCFGSCSTNNGLPAIPDLPDITFQTQSTGAGSMPAGAKWVFQVNQWHVSDNSAAVEVSFDGTTFQHRLGANEPVTCPPDYSYGGSYRLYAEGDHLRGELRCATVPNDDWDSLPDTDRVALDLGASPDNFDWSEGYQIALSAYGSSDADSLMILNYITVNDGRMASVTGTLSSRNFTARPYTWWDRVTCDILWDEGGGGISVQYSTNGGDSWTTAPGDCRTGSVAIGVQSSQMRVRLRFNAGTGYTSVSNVDLHYREDNTAPSIYMWVWPDWPDPPDPQDWPAPVYWKREIVTAAWDHESGIDPNGFGPGVRIQLFRSGDILIAQTDSDFIDELACNFLPSTGTWQIYARVKDLAGHEEQSNTVTMYCDMTDPVASAYVSADWNPSISASGTDAHSGIYQTYVEVLDASDNLVWEWEAYDTPLEIEDMCAPYFYLPATTSSDAYRLRVRAVDNVGRQATVTSSNTFGCDWGEPQSAINAVTPEYLNQPVTLTYTATDASSGVASAVLLARQDNNTDWPSPVVTFTTSMEDWTPPAQGRWYVASRATDVAGNVETNIPANDTSGDATFFYDTVSPPAPGNVIVAPLGVRQPSVAWDASIDPGAPITGSGVISYAAIIETAQGAQVASFSVNAPDTSGVIPAPLAEGAYTAHVIAYDRAGNASAASSKQPFSVDEPTLLPRVYMPVAGGE